MDEKDKQRTVLDLFQETVLEGRRLIFVVGYPRSGTTWLTRLLAQCLNSPALSWSTKNDVRLPKYRDPAIEGLDRRGRFAVRHGHWKVYERDLRREKIVVLHRDPRDVAVSCFHYFGFRRKGEQGLVDCVNEMCGGKGKILDFVNVNKRGWAGYTWSWLGASVVNIQYEDLLAETETTIKDVIKRLGIPRQPDKRVKQAVRDHTFANRRKDKTMRKGIVGGWKGELPKPLAEKLANHCGREMVKLGYLEKLTEPKPRPSIISLPEPQPEPEPQLESQPPLIVAPKRVQRHVLLNKKRGR